MKIDKPFVLTRADGKQFDKGTVRELLDVFAALDGSSSNVNDGACSWRCCGVGANGHMEFTDSLDSLGDYLPHHKDEFEIIEVGSDD